MKKPEITEKNTKLLYDAKFVKLFDMEYEEGKHYFQSSRHDKSELTAVKSDDEVREMIPDAVTCIVILKSCGEEPKILLTQEYRYPAGRYLLSPTAGLIDKDDKKEKNPLISAAKREIFEETGLKVKDSDRIFTVNRAVFSTPGMTDESNGIVCAVIKNPEISELSHKNAQDGELFRGFYTYGKNEAGEILKRGTDGDGMFYSLYTWAALLYFCSGLWEDET